MQVYIYVYVRMDACIMYVCMYVWCDIYTKSVHASRNLRPIYPKFKKLCIDIYPINLWQRNALCMRQPGFRGTPWGFRGTP
jgi:hypothetical protein